MHALVSVELGLASRQRGMYALTHIIFQYMFVLMRGRMRLCLSARLRSRVTETVAQTMLGTVYQPLIGNK